MRILFFFVVVAASSRRGPLSRRGGARPHGTKTIDEQLYSRQLLTFGRDAQRQLSNGRVLVVGAGGISSEVCKNLALAGIAKLTISSQKMGNWQFFGEGGLARGVADLNPYCEVAEADEAELLRKIEGGEFDCVVACSTPPSQSVDLNDACRRSSAGFVYAAIESGGKIVLVEDLGPRFESIDREPPLGSADEPKLVESCKSSSSGGTRFVLAGGERHECQVGDALSLDDDERTAIVSKIVRPDTLEVSGGYFENTKSIRVLPGRSTLSGRRLDVANEAVEDDETPTPLRAVAGGVAAHECLKYLAGGLLGPPADRWTLDLSGELPEQIDAAAAANKLKGASVFVVGAGATGCELLKNLALMGVGRVVVADDDAIETSNLNRQFLFRKKDLGSSKAKIAAQRAGSFGSTKIVGIDKRVEASTAEFFEKEILASCDCVFSALDNVEARRFVDKLCVAHGKPFIDTGTLGPRGSVQVCLPHVTETYGAASDPEDAAGGDAVALCTLKQHPYKIDHVVAWAADLYAGYFDRRVKRLDSLLRSYSSRGGGVRSWLRTLEKGDEDPVAEALEDVRDLVRIVSKQSSSSSPSSSTTHLAAWAGREYYLHFRKRIEVLTRDHPKDSADEDEPDLPYWSGTRVWPKPCESIVEPDFVRAAVRLRAKALGLSLDDEDFDDDLMITVAQRSFVGDQKGENSEEQEVTVEALERSLARLAYYNGDKPQEALSPLSFDKDDELDLRFVVAAANSRASIFSIPAADPLRCRQIAGRVVPAIATTTAVVSGLAALEFFKIVANTGKEIRNSFVNLALPDRWTIAEPFPCERWTLPDGKIVSEWSPRKHILVPSAASVDDLLSLVLSEYFATNTKTPTAHVASLSREGDGDLLYLPAAAIFFKGKTAHELLTATDDDDRDDQDGHGEADEKESSFVDVVVTVSPGDYRPDSGGEEEEEDAGVPLPPVRLWLDDDAYRNRKSQG